SSPTHRTKPRRIRGSHHPACHVSRLEVSSLTTPRRTRTRAPHASHRYTVAGRAARRSRPGHADRPPSGDSRSACAGASSSIGEGVLKSVAVAVLPDLADRLLPRIGDVRLAPIDHA